MEGKILLVDYFERVVGTSEVWPIIEKTVVII